MSHLLDTCVISELVRPEPNTGLLRWFSEQDEDGLFLSVLTIGELERGIEKLATSRRKTTLGKWVREHLARRFEGRLLPIDLPVAQRWGAIAGAYRAQGTVAAGYRQSYRRECPRPWSHCCLAQRPGFRTLRRRLPEPMASTVILLTRPIPRTMLWPLSGPSCRSLR